jgi:xanthine/uracil permease
MANVVDRRENTNNWQDWVNLILAVWLFISPWVLNFAGQQRPSWDAWIVGIIVGVLSIAALTQVQDWEEWINLLLGAWLFISPWVLGFSDNHMISSNAWIVGVLIFLVAASELTVVKQIKNRP